MRYKTGECREQATLLPRTIEEYLPDNHLAKLVWTIVNLLRLDKIITKYSEIGQNPFDPRIIVAILFYGYAIGIRSSRKLAKACIERLDFMYLAAKLRPSHKTISEIRRENIGEIKEIFQEIIMIGIRLGLVKIGNIKVSIDGSKIRANASSKLSKDEEGLKKLLCEVEEKVATIMKEAEGVDNEEDIEYGDNRGDELPKELERLERRRSKIEGAIEEIREEKERIREGLEKEKGVVSKKEEEKIERAKINLTDKDAKYMKEREGCIKTNYNVQASVDETNQFILANDVTDESNDKRQLIPMIEKTEENIEAEINKGKADSGYHSADNLADASMKEIDVYIDDPNKQRVGNNNYKYDKVNFKYDSQTDSYICPEGKELELVSAKEDKSIYRCRGCDSCSAKESCTKSRYKTITRGKNEHFVEANREKILSDEGAKEYKKRMHTVEPVFGNIKYNLGFRQFLLRGLKKVKGEFNLMCIAHNLKKIESYCIENQIDLKMCLA